MDFFDTQPERRAIVSFDSNNPTGVA